ncbi:MAG: type II secretion system F family protein [Endomicrobium sp.]|jgi:tight adherence protein C|nr:type II secretion system F family protein [Endomicrobium sp.]
MFLLLFCVSLFIAIFFAADIFLAGITTMETEGKVHNAVEKKKSKSFIIPVILRWADGIGFLFSKIKYKKFQNYMQKLQSDLTALGGDYEKFDSHQHFALCLFSMFTGILFCVCFISTDIILIVIIAVLFFSLPIIKVKEAVKRRREAVLKQLPDMADLLSVMMESGLDFFSAADKVITILKGPLADDFKDSLAKISLGYDKKAALNEMVVKSGVEQLGFFIRTINMALDAGVGMSDTLKRLAEQMRMERTAAAEKKAQEAPIKMLIPLVLFIFPTIFIAIFGPIVINFVQTGGF